MVMYRECLKSKLVWFSDNFQNLDAETAKNRKLKVQSHNPAASLDHSIHYNLFSCIENSLGYPAQILDTKDHKSVWKLD